MATRYPSLIAALTAALVVAALALAGAFTFFTARPAGAQVTATGPVRQVSVVGSGVVKARPDTAYVQIGVETSAATTQQALAQNNTQAQAIIAKIKELGVADKDIQTSGFSINPTYDNQGRQVTGYSVTNTVSVTIRNLEKAGALLDQVVQAGANRIYGISFGVADPSALLNQARDQAVADAKVRAEQLAKAAGVKVGQVLVISENVAAAVPVPMARAEMAQGAAGVPVEAGEQSFTAQVQVTYELR